MTVGVPTTAAKMAPGGHVADEREEQGKKDEVPDQVDSPCPSSDDEFDGTQPEAGRTAEVYRLCTYEQSPPYLQHNPFIRTGYRVNFSFRLCLHSLLRLHNGSRLLFYFILFIIYL